MTAVDIEALMAGRKVVKNPRLLVDDSVLKYQAGQMDEALKLIEEAVSIEPTAKNYLYWAMYLSIVGRFEEVRDKSYKALEIDPDSVEAYNFLRESKKFAKDDPDIEKMIALDRKIKKDPLERRASMKFNLGKALYDAGEHERAFSYWVMANQFKHDMLKPPKNMIEQMNRELQGIMDLFTPALVKSLEGVGAASERPVFVLGMPRSGTTLVEQILASHPDVFGVGESALFHTSLPSVPRVKGQVLLPHEQMAQALKPDLLRATGERFLRKLDEQNKTAKRVVDKQLFNHIFAGMICLSLPQARLIHCIRNPMDVGLSIYRSDFVANWPWASDLANIGHAYNGYARLMDHWRGLFPNRIHTIQYERLTEHQEEESRKLIAFCGLEWNERCLNFHDTAKDVKTASIYQVRQPMYKKSVAAWKRFEEQLKPLYNVVRHHMEKDA